MFCKDAFAIKVTNLVKRDENVRGEFPQRRTESTRVLMCPGDSMIREAVMHPLRIQDLSQMFTHE